ncbi:hypothetical protein [Parabacteroides distasonis]|uniref:hypothetical protein n=1 Tax=Parabacteroides distasonis TaxID=823 RepID=UPI0034A32C9A
MEDNKLLRYEAEKKSLIIAFVLTFFFGPFGLLYTSFWAMCAMLFILFLIVAAGGWAGILALGLGGSLIYWGICVIIGVFSANSHNQELLRKIMNEGQITNKEKTLNAEIRPIINKEITEDTNVIKSQNTVSKEDINTKVSDKWRRFCSLFIAITLFFYYFYHIGVFDWFQEKSQSDYIKNEITIGKTSGNSTAEKKPAILSDTIRLKTDSVCLNMNPFTFKTGLILTDVSSEIQLSNSSNLGANIYLILNFKNISAQKFKKDIKVTWKIRDPKTGSIKYDGTNILDFEASINPNESWMKEINILECTAMYNKKLNILIELDEIPVEDITIRPKY